MLRAILSVDGASVKTLTRGFEIAPPKVLLTSADGLGSVAVDAELFLPAGAVGHGAIYTNSGEMIHIVRKIILRIGAKLDYLILKLH